MASIQQSLNSMFAATLGAGFAVAQAPTVKNMLAVRDAKRSLMSSEEEAQAIHEKGGWMRTQDRNELLSGVAARESEQLEKLASLAGSGAEAAGYRERAQYMRQASEGYQNLSRQHAALRQANLQRSRAEVANAVEIRRAIIQGLSPERQKEIMKETRNG